VQFIHADAETLNDRVVNGVLRMLQWKLDFSES
jgi:hypothetical protein